MTALFALWIVWKVLLWIAGTIFVLALLIYGLNSYSDQRNYRPSKRMWPPS